jgi:hypothetical protein
LFRELARAERLAAALAQVAAAAVPRCCDELLSDESLRRAHTCAHACIYEATKLSVSNHRATADLDRAKLAASQKVIDQRAPDTYALSRCGYRICEGRLG